MWYARVRVGFGEQGLEEESQRMEMSTRRCPANEAWPAKEAGIQGPEGPPSWHLDGDFSQSVMGGSVYEQQL